MDNIINNSNQVNLDDHEKPQTNGFTIYSKSGCPNCTRIKKILSEKHGLSETVLIHNFFWGYPYFLILFSLNKKR